MNRLSTRGQGSADDPAVWIDFAKSDLAIAKIGGKPGIHWGSLCFHCQQAAEKAIKAVLVGRRVAFPKIHDLDKLFALVPADLTPSPGLRVAILLTDYAEAGRYPMYFEEIGEKEHREAVRLASAVLVWAEEVLHREGQGGGMFRETQAPYRSKKSRKKRGKK